MGIVEVYAKRATDISGQMKNQGEATSCAVPGNGWLVVSGDSGGDAPVPRAWYLQHYESDHVSLQPQNLHSEHFAHSSGPENIR